MVAARSRPHTQSPPARSRRAPRIAPRPGWRACFCSLPSALVESPRTPSQSSTSATTEVMVDLGVAGRDNTRNVRNPRSAPPQGQGREGQGGAVPRAGRAEGHRGSPPGRGRHRAPRQGRRLLATAHRDPVVDRGREVGRDPPARQAGRGALRRGRVGGSRRKPHHRSLRQLEPRQQGRRGSRSGAARRAGPGVGRAPDAPGQRRPGRAGEAAQQGGEARGLRQLLGAQPGQRRPDPRRRRRDHRRAHAGGHASQRGGERPPGRGGGGPLHRRLVRKPAPAPARRRAGRRPGRGRGLLRHRPGRGPDPHRLHRHGLRHRGLAGLHRADPVRAPGRLRVPHPAAGVRRHRHEQRPAVVAVAVRGPGPRGRTGDLVEVAGSGDREEPGVLESSRTVVRGRRRLLRAAGLRAQVRLDQHAGRARRDARGPAQLAAPRGRRVGDRRDRQHAHRATPVRRPPTTSLPSASSPPRRGTASRASQSRRPPKPGCTTTAR